MSSPPQLEMEVPLYFAFTKIITIIIIIMWDLTNPECLLD